MNKGRGVPRHSITFGGISSQCDTTASCDTIGNTPQVRLNRPYSKLSPRDVGIKGSITKAIELKAGSRVLKFCYDTGERYLSVEGLFPGA